MSETSRRSRGGTQGASDSAGKFTLGGSVDGGPDTAWRIEDLDRLQDLGLYLIPLRGKRPMVKWRHGGRDYVQVAPTTVEIRAWSGMSPDGWAVLCGGPAGIVVLDVEKPGLTDPGGQGAGIRSVVAMLPASCRRDTPSGGLHAVLRVVDGPVPSASGARLVERLEPDGAKTLLAELRTEGHYAGILGPGRGALPAGFHPHDIRADRLEGIIEQLRELSDVPHSLSRAGAAAGDHAAEAGSWLADLPSCRPCRKVQAQIDVVFKALALDQLTPALLGPVLQLVRLASYGHQGVPEALEEAREEFLHRVDLRGNRSGGRAQAAAQWHRSVSRATEEVGRPAWLGQGGRRVCGCWLDEFQEAYGSARPPFKSKGRAGTTEGLVIGYILSRARLDGSPVVRQSQRQISEATTVGLQYVNKAIRRLEEQGWIVRHRSAARSIHGLELVIPEDVVTGTTKTPPEPEGSSVVPLVRGELHWLFGNRGLGPGVAETFSHLPEYRLPFGRSGGALVRVSPGGGAALRDRGASSRPLPAARRVRPPTEADLVRRTGKSPSTVRRHLTRLADAGLAFRDESGRWWRYLVHPDWAAEQRGVTDPTPARREMFDRQRRIWLAPQVAAGEVARVETGDCDHYVDVGTGQVLWIDRDPPRTSDPSAPSDTDTSSTDEQGDSPS